MVKFVRPGGSLVRRQLYLIRRKRRSTLLNKPRTNKKKNKKQKRNNNIEIKYSRVVIKNVAEPSCLNSGPEKRKSISKLFSVRVQNDLAYSKYSRTLSLVSLTGQICVHMVREVDAAFSLTCTWKMYGFPHQLNIDRRFAPRSLELSTSRQK